MFRTLAVGALRLLLGALGAGLVVAALAGGPTPRRARRPRPPGAAGPMGGACWSIVPNAGGTNLESVSARAADDIWAVGYTSSATGTLGLIQHWDGSAWHLVPNPNPHPAAPDTESLAWRPSAAPTSGPSGWSPTGSSAKTLIEHWDGSLWTIVPSPNPATSAAGLLAVAAISADDVWAVGGAGSSVYLSDQTLVEHWDGRQWSIIPSPNPSADGNGLRSVAAAGSDEVWAVGFRGRHGSSQTLIERWDGQQWTSCPVPIRRVATPPRGLGRGPGAAWAVGYTLASRSVAWCCVGTVASGK